MSSFNSFELVHRDTFGQIQSAQISPGGTFVIALVNNKLYTFGRNDFGQLGIGEVLPLRNLRPTNQSELNDVYGNILQIYAGDKYFIMINDRGVLHSVGKCYWHLDQFQIH